MASDATITVTARRGRAGEGALDAAPRLLPARAREAVPEAGRPPLFRRYAGETYYGLPALKPSPYGWLVGLYIFTGGLAGAAQIIATVADLLGPPAAAGLVRRGRLVALAGAVIGGPLLIIDLHRPGRFLNMLRIFRKTSPMSIGTYILMSFGAFSALAALGSLPGLRVVGRIAGVPAALAGAGMTSYTAALLAATSTPLWAAQPRLLGARFASSAMATGAAALSLGQRLSGEAETCSALDSIAMTASGAELALSLAGEGRLPPQSSVASLGIAALCEAAPLVLYGLSRGPGASARRLSLLASVAVLAGGLLMRVAILKAGNASAKRPTDYFRMTQLRGVRGGASARRQAWAS